MGSWLNTTQLSLIENWEVECTHPTKNSWFLIITTIIPCIPSRDNTQVWVPRGRSRLASLIMTLNDSSRDFIFLVSITLGSERFEFLVSTCLAGDYKSPRGLWTMAAPWAFWIPVSRDQARRGSLSCQGSRSVRRRLGSFSHNWGRDEHVWNGGFPPGSLRVLHCPL